MLLYFFQKKMSLLFLLQNNSKLEIWTDARGEMIGVNNFSTRKADIHIPLLRI